jgi:hypothetical protein
MEQTIASLFQPDSLVSAQYWETVCREDHLEPEKRLMLAVLEEAIRNYRKYLVTHPRLFSEVVDWFLEKDSDWLFSFENICDVLELSPNHIRKGLIGWTVRQLAGRPDADLEIKNRQQHRVVNSNIWSRRTSEQLGVAL